MVHRQRRLRRADRSPSPEHRHRRNLAAADRRFRGRLPRHRLRSQGLGQELGRSRISQPGSIAGDLDALADHLKLEKFHLLGVASSIIALDYAAWRPEKIRSLIVGGSTGSFEDKAIADFIARIAIPEIRKQSAHYREIGASYRGANPEGTRRWIEIDEHARPAGRGLSAAAAHAEHVAKIAAITAPTLVIAADADLLAPPALMRIWAAHLKHHEWAVIHDAGHAMAWEQPGAFDDKVLDFLWRH